MSTDDDKQDNDKKTEAEQENTDDSLRVSNEETAAPIPAERTTEEVRQGHTGDHVRYILIFSFIGALIALLIVYLAFLR